MQKKIKSRLVDVLVIIICLTGSALSVWQFWKELNKTLVKLNDEPIATITFKYNTAQRKFSDDLVWDRLRQNSPVYNGDTIRTADFSEATIYFNDGNIMDLSENTMARVSLSSGGGAAVDFSGGQIAVQSSDSGFTITSGSSTVDLVKGASVTASSATTAASDSSSGKTEDVFRVQVQSGTAELSTGSQAVSLDAGSAADMKGNGSVVQKNLSVLSPDPESKILSFEDGPVPVEFEWNSHGEDVKIEFSDTKNFANIRETYEYSGSDNVSFMLPAGTNYWRITCEDEVLSGKVTIYSTKAPSAIAPVEDYTAHYRSVKPSIRFIWSESERSTTYAFEVADNPDMRNPVISQRIQQTSSIVTTLDEGRWYWRVTPYYTINNIGLSHPSDVYSFSIEKSGALEAPELLLPKSGAIVSTKLPESAGGGAQNILFSWKDNPEAASYIVTITPDSPAYGSEIKQTVSTNYYSLDTSAIQIGNGGWKWSVEMTDVEGNAAKSEKVPFLAMDSEISQKVLFPTEGYILSSTRVYDTSFVWKSNLTSDMEVQFSHDPSFRTLETSLVTKNTTASGFDLPVGNYYWRIVTNTEVGSFASDAVNFEVEGPLAAPACVAPDDGSRVVVEDYRTIALKWKPVPTADYYQLRVYGSDDMSDVIYENTFIEDDGSSEFTEYVSFDKMPEKTYYWSVQAYRDEKTNMSRAVGTLGKYSFFLRILKPITLSAPNDRVTFEGLDVVMNPPEMAWNSIDELSESELRIYRDSVDDENVVAVIEEPERSLAMPRLYEGSYFWTVRGMTYDDLDASSKQVRNFTVKKIPPMDAPVIVSPRKTDLFSTAYFDRTFDVTFSWNPVMYATKYIFSLSDEEGNVLRSAEILSPETSYTVDFSDFIHDGKYTWTIEARTIFDDGVVRYGNTNQSDITITLPDMDAPVKNPVGTQDVLTEDLYHVEKSIRFSWKAVPYADEYVFTLKNSHGTVLAKELMRSRNVAAANRNTTPDTFFVYNNVNSLEPGTYKWSVEARNYMNGKMMQPGKTEDSTFTIKVSDMASPEKVYPTPGQVFSSELFKADAGLRFEWLPVEFADEYIFRMYDYDGNVILEQPTKETNYVYENLEAFEKSKYSWSVEARCYLNNKLLQAGEVKKAQFEIYLPTLKAPEKISPEEGHELNAEFFLSGKSLTFSWKKIKYADEYILTVVDPDGETIIETSIEDEVSEELSYIVPCGKLLNRGDYTWSVEALSHYHGQIMQNGTREESSFSVVIPNLASPEPILPAENTVLGAEFFKKDEPLAFSWNTVPLADEYLFKLYAPDDSVIAAQFGAETSVTVDASELLEKGEYRWHAEALSHYEGELFQEGDIKDIAFTVELPDLDAPKQISPAADAVYSTAFFKKDAPELFSWKQVPFADEYIFKLYAADGSVAAEYTGAETSVSIDDAAFVMNGEYTWTVEARSYFREEILQNGIVASQNFETAVPLLDAPKLTSPKTKSVYDAAYFKGNALQAFSWNEVSFADEYVFRLEKLSDSDANTVVKELVLPANTRSINLETELYSYEGEYRWTVEARTYFRDKILQTGNVAEFSFSVVMPPLGIPGSKIPADGTEYGLPLFMRDGVIEFSWKPVAEADCYALLVTGEDGSIIVDELFQAAGVGSDGIFRYRADAPAFAKEGEYQWNVEARVIYNNRIIQKSGNAANTFIVSLPPPAAPELTSGGDLLVDAEYITNNNAVKFSWNAIEYADEYSFVLYDKDGSTVKAKRTIEAFGSSSTTILALSEFLSPGTYNWTVEGIIHYLDKVFLCSELAHGKVTTVFPEFVAPAAITPENEGVLDVSYFRQNREIVFSWEPVQYATGYRFAFYDADGTLLMSQIVEHGSTEAVFTDLPRLEQGEFRWTVQAYLTKDDTLLTDGAIAENEFKIELPTLKAPTVEETGRLYGN